MTEQTTGVARFFTLTRKIPHLVGRLHDGTRLPGGPYTLTQLAVAVIVLAAGFFTMPLWSFASWLVQVPLVLIVGWAAAFLVGQIPIQRRNVLAAAVAALSAYTKPSAGKVRGHALRTRKPHLVRSRFEVPSPPPQTPTLTPAVAPELTEPIATGATPDRRAEPVAEVSSVPLSGMERLLLQTQES